MPTVLRLCRENPREVPATGSGSQRYFDPEVLPVLRRLREAEVLEERGPGVVEVVGPVEVAQEAPAVVAVEDLGERIEALTRRLEVLTEEVREVRVFLGRPRRVEVRFPMGSRRGGPRR